MGIGVVMLLRTNIVYNAYNHAFVTLFGVKEKHPTKHDVIDVVQIGGG